LDNTELDKSHDAPRFEMEFQKNSATNIHLFQHFVFTLAVWVRRDDSVANPLPQMAH
jgi:hypothetical protein